MRWEKKNIEKRTKDINLNSKIEKERTVKETEKALQQNKEKNRVNKSDQKETIKYIQTEGTISSKKQEKTQSKRRNYNGRKKIRRGKIRIYSRGMSMIKQKQKKKTKMKNLLIGEVSMKEEEKQQKNLKS